MLLLLLELKIPKLTAAEVLFPELFFCEVEEGDLGPLELRAAA